MTETLTVSAPDLDDPFDEYYGPWVEFDCPACGDAPTPGLALPALYGLIAAEFECPNCGEQIRVEIED